MRTAPWQIEVSRSLFFLRTSAKNFRKISDPYAGLQIRKNRFAFSFKMFSEKNSVALLRDIGYL